LLEHSFAGSRLTMAASLTWSFLESDFVAARFLSFPLSPNLDSELSTENHFSDVPEQDPGLKTLDKIKKSGPEGEIGPGGQANCSLRFSVHGFQS
jgi:hypothetical protein